MCAGIEKLEMRSYFIRNQKSKRIRKDFLPILFDPNMKRII